MGQAANEIVIDLGEVPERDLEQIEPDHRARWARPWLAAISVVALIGGVVSSAAPAPPSPWATPLVISSGHAADRGVVIAGDLLLAPEPGPRASVVAWDLRERTRRWSIEWQFDQLTNAAMISGLVVATGYRDVPSDGPPGNPVVRTLALDPVTGATRWERPGTALVQSRSPDRLLLMENDDRGFVATAVDPATGTELWRFDGRDQSTFVFSESSWQAFQQGGGVDETLVIRPDGSLLSLSLATGATVKLGQLLPVGGANVMDFDETTVTVEMSKDTDGDPTNGHDESYVVMYDRATMGELWRTAVRTPAGGSYFGRCGQMLCEHSESGTTARVLRTGQAVWSSRALPYTVWKRPGGDLFIGQTSEGRETVLLDPASGRERLALGRWQFIGQWDGALIVGLPGESGELPWIGLISATGDLRIRPISAFGRAGARFDNCMVVREWLTCLVISDAAVVNLTDALRPGR